MAARFLFLHRLLKNPQPLARLANHLASRHPLIVSSPKPRINFRSAFNPWRGMAHGGSVSLVLSPENRPRFEAAEVEAPSKRKKWQSKKRLKEQRRREKRKRRDANKRDPRRIRPKGKKIKQKFPTAEARIKYKIEKAKLKEAILVERLKKYEVPKLQGPMPKEENLTGEERFYMKKMAQKKSNYVPVGRRGIFGGVILNMHLHWKKHETVKVICKPCKPGQVHEYVKEIARLSGGIPIQIIGDDTIIFYRGKNYVQPEVMSPIDTLSKRKALEKSKYEQSLETVRRFIAISEKELELYYRHVALYGDPNTRNSDLVYGNNRKRPQNVEKGTSDGLSMDISDDIDSDYSFSDNELEVDSNGEELSEHETDSNGEELSKLEVDSNGEELSEPEFDVEDEADSDSEFTEHETDSEGEELSENEENSSRMVTS